MKDFFTHHISRFPLLFCSFGLRYFIMHILFSVYFLKNLVEIRWKEQSITNYRFRYVMLFFWTTYFTLLFISGEYSLVLFIPYLLHLLLTFIKFTSWTFFVPSKNSMRIWIFFWFQTSHRGWSTAKIMYEIL